MKIGKVNVVWKVLELFLHSFGRMKGCLYCVRLLCLIGLIPHVVCAESIPIDTLIRRTYSFPNRYSLRAEEYSAVISARSHLQTRRRNAVTRWVRGLFTFERGEHEYKTQSRMLLQRHINGMVDIKEVEFYSTMPRLHGTSELIKQRFNLAIYSSQLFTNNILSPFNHRNRRYYEYELVYLFMEDGSQCAHIKVKPHFLNTQLVSGTYDIDVVTGAVINFDLSFFYDAISIRAVGKVPRQGLASLFPQHVAIFINLNFLGNRLKAKYDVDITYHFGISSLSAFASQNRYDLTHLYRLRVDTSRVIRKQQPLWKPSPIESSAQDSLTSDTTLCRLKKENHHFSWSDFEDLFFDRHNFHFGTNSLRLPAILTPEMFAWSHRKGFQMQTRLKISFQIKNDHAIYFTPKTSYSFKQRSFYWRLPIDYSFLPALDAHMRLEAGNGNRGYSRQQKVLLQTEISDSLIEEVYKHSAQDFESTNYKDFYLRSFLSFQPKVGLRITAGFNYHRRTLYISNNLAWLKPKLLEQLAHTLYTFAPHVRLEWTPKLYYYRMGTRKIPLYSHWPTFRLDYERGLRTRRFKSSYERYELDMQYAYQMYALKTFFFRFGMGLFTNRSSQSFIAYELFCDEEILTDWADEMSGRFYLLSSSWYNESPYYIKVSVAYESPMLLFSRLPGLTRFVEKERIYVNVVSLKSLPLYGEVGYGISTPILDMSGFLSLGNKMRAGIGGRVVLHW